jgi:2-alkyl-3-oxoalkanoate reductase
MALKTPISVGIVGAGFIVDSHLRALQRVPGTVVEAICDPSGPRVQAVQKNWRIPHGFASLEEMLERSPVQAVHILTPPATHIDTALRCVARGRHTLVEKPLGLCVADCRKLQEAAAEAGVTVAVNHNFACHPAYLKLIREISSGSLGAPQHVTAFLNVPLRQLSKGQHGHWMFQEPGNIIFEQAVHPLSQIYPILGRVKTAVALPSGARVLSTGKVFYDTWQISLLCERGSAQCFLSFGREYSDFWLHVVGQDGCAMVDLRHNTMASSHKTRFMEPVDLMLERARYGRAVSRQGLRNFVDYALGFLKLRPPADSFGSGMRTRISSFYGAIVSGKPPALGLDHGLAAIEACEMMIESGRGFLPEGNAR